MKYFLHIQKEYSIEFCNILSSSLTFLFSKLVGSIMVWLVVYSYSMHFFYDLGSR